MIIVDNNTEKKLMAELEAFLRNPSDLQCQYIQRGSSRALQEVSVAAICGIVQRLLEDDAAMIYACEDQDVFILSEALSFAAADSIRAEVFAMAGTGSDEDFLLFDMRARCRHLMTIVRAKLDALALARKQEEEQKRAEARQKQKQEMLNLQVSQGSVQALSAKRRARGRHCAMVVEDDRFIRNLVEHSLRDDCEVKTSETGRQALLDYAATAPDILFLDIELPDINGFEILKRVRGLDPEAYIVMLSGNSGRENITQAIELGARGFVGKPFTRQKLKQYLAQSPHAIGRSRQQQLPAQA